jgi:hypothetical protein
MNKVHLIANGSQILGDGMELLWQFGWYVRATISIN